MLFDANSFDDLERVVVRRNPAGIFSIDLFGVVKAWRMY